AFLKGYFDHFAFRSITTPAFVAYLDEHLLRGDAERAARANVAAWLYQPGIPEGAPALTAAALTRVEGQARAVAPGPGGRGRPPGAGSAPPACRRRRGRHRNGCTS